LFHGLIVDRQQTFQYGLSLFTPSSYHEDVIIIVAVIVASENGTRPTTEV
jgi:hypothetical protein